MDEKIIAYLLKLQRKLDLNETEFSAYLGISPGEWSRFKNGKRKLSDGFKMSLIEKPSSYREEILKIMTPRKRKVGNLINN